MDASDSLRTMFCDLDGLLSELDGCCGVVEAARQLLLAIGCVESEPAVEISNTPCAMQAR